MRLPGICGSGVARGRNPCSPREGVASTMTGGEYHRTGRRSYANVRQKHVSINSPSRPDTCHRAWRGSASSPNVETPGRASDGEALVQRPPRQGQRRGSSAFNSATDTFWQAACSLDLRTGSRTSRHPFRFLSRPRHQHLEPLCDPPIAAAHVQHAAPGHQHQRRIADSA